MRSLVARTERELGPAGILVKCAGVMYYTLMKTLREQEWERTVEVNCKGVKLRCGRGAGDAGARPGVT